MGGIKLIVHPLFFVLFLYEALLGNILNFAIVTLTAVMHELGHSFSAFKRGYVLNKIVITPFGAVVSGCKDFNLKDQAIIAFSGPLLNLLVGFFTVALWWIFPETYAFTDLIAFANFSMAIINLLPCYPLDGGRILYSLLASKFSGDTAYKVCKGLGVGLSLLIIMLFFIALKNGFNVSMLLFGTFTLVGALSVKKENKYVRIYLSLSPDKLAKGLVCKKVAIDKNSTVKALFSILDFNTLNEVAVYDGEKELTVFSQEKLRNILENANYKQKISAFL